MLKMIDQSDASSYCIPLGNKRQARSNTRRYQDTSAAKNIRMIVAALFALDKLPYYLLVALLTQVELMPGLRPLGIGFAAACLLLRDPLLNLGIMCWVAGVLAFIEPMLMPMYLVLLILLWVCVVVLKATWEGKIGQYAFCVAVLAILFKGIPALANGAPPYVLLSISIYGSLAGVCCVLFAPGVGVLKSKSLPFSSKEFISLSLVGLGAIIGIGTVRVLGFQIVYVISGLAILTAAYVGGAGSAAALGTTVGIGLMLPLSTPTLLLGSLGFPGTIAGLFRHKARGWMVFGFLTSQAILYLCLAPLLIDEMAASLIAGLIFLLIPRKALDSMQRFLPVQYQQVNVTEATLALKECFTDKLSGMSRVFEELASTFTDDGDSEQSRQSKLNRICEYISEKACCSCVSYRNCWETNFYQTYWDFVELLASFENRNDFTFRDLPPRLQKCCLHSHKLTSTLKEAVERLRISNYWGQRVNESRGIVRRQLIGVSSIIKEVAAQFEVGACTDMGIQRVLKEQLTLHGLLPTEVLVTDEGGVRRITLERERLCHGQNLCSNRIPGLINQITGESYAVWQRGCVNEARCRCTFLPVREFSLETIAVNVPKDTVSGDEWTKLSLPNGQIALLVSDGMGIGPEAAKESKATINMLGKMLENGFDKEFALQTVNSVLLLRSAKETFATIDLALIDMYTGQAEFIKIGSTPSFIVRKDEVEIVRANSLPVGIFPDIEIHSQTRTLEHGDILVMITDGVIDPQNDIAASEQWVAELLAHIKTNDPGKIARKVLEEIRKIVGEELPDDVTIVVSRITRCTPKHHLPSEDIPLYVRLGQ